MMMQDGTEDETDGNRELGGVTKQSASEKHSHVLRVLFSLWSSSQAAHYNQLDSF